MTLDDPYVQRLRQELVDSIAVYPKRMKRRRRVIIALVSVAVLLTYSAAIATGTVTWRIWPTPDDLPPGVEPSALGPEMVIATGVDTTDSTPWRLTAFQSDKGICIHIEKPRSKGGGCGSPVPEKAISWMRSSDRRTAFFFGPLRRDVVRVEFLFADQKPLSIEPVGISLGFDVIFYVAQFSSDVRVESIVAYDADGRRLGSVEPVSLR